jgi:hypothetical protein
VKFTRRAPGATSSIVRACSSIAGIVRNAIANPPGPVVSCPSTPCFSGSASSKVRARSCPRADRGEDEPRVRERGAWVVVAAELERPAPLPAQEPAERGHRLESAGIAVVEHDLLELILVLDQAVQHEGRAHPVAEHRELHVTYGTGGC